MRDKMVRVLAIPEGEEKDAEGRGIGDDWLIADLGLGESLVDSDKRYYHYYVTTDRVHGSEYSMMEFLDAQNISKCLAGKINDEWLKQEN